MKGHKAEITDLKSNDGLLYSADISGELRVSDLTKEKVVLGIKMCNEISSFEIMGHSIIVASKASINLFDTRSKIVINKPDQTLTVANDDINQISLHRNKEFVSAVDDNGELIILDLRSNAVYKRLKLHQNVAQCVAFRPNRPWQVLSCSFDSKALLTDFSRGSILKQIEFESLDQKMQINSPFVSSCCFDDSGNKMVIGRYNGILQLAESAGGSKKKEKWNILDIDAHRWAINSIAFDSEDQIISTGLDGNITLWDRYLSSKVSNLEYSGQKFNAITILSSCSTMVTVAVGGCNPTKQGVITISSLEKLEKK